MDAEITLRMRRRPGARALKRFCKKHDLKPPQERVLIKHAEKAIADNLAIVRALENSNDPNFNRYAAIKLLLDFNAKIQGIAGDPERMHSQTAGYIRI